MATPTARVSTIADALANKSMTAARIAPYVEAVAQVYGPRYLPEDTGVDDLTDGQKAKVFLRHLRDHLVEVRAGAEGPPAGEAVRLSTIATVTAEGKTDMPEETIVEKAP